MEYITIKQVKRVGDFIEVMIGLRVSRDGINKKLIESWEDLLKTIAKEKEISIDEAKSLSEEETLGIKAEKKFLDLKKHLKQRNPAFIP